MAGPTLAQALFEPRGIALIGASDEKGRNNSRPQIFLKKHGYKGKVYPVHPKRKTVYKVKAYPSVTKIPGPVDHAFIMTGPSIVPGIIRECGKAGVKVATVFTADFAESGSDGAKLQAQVVAEAKKGGVRVIGPNCMGVYCMDPPAMISPNTVLQLPEIYKGKIGVISHSGSLTGTFLSRGQHRGIGFSKMVSIGNECDLSVAEVGEMLVDDPKTECILLFLETIRHEPAFTAMVRRAYEAGKPVVVYKIGRSEAAQEFTASHTGAIAGTDSAVDAYFKHHGVVRVDQFETLLEMPNLLLGRRPRPGKRVSILTTTGGGGGMTVDRLGVNGMIPTALPDEAVARIEAAGGMVSNGPLIDLTFKGATRENTDRVLKEIMDSDANDAAVMVIGSSAQFNPEVSVQSLLPYAHSEKPLGGFLVPEAAESGRLLTEAGLPNFRTPENCADGMRAYLEWREPLPVPKTASVDLKPVRAALNEAKAKALDERECRAVFDALGIRQVAAAFAKTVKAAATAGSAVGYPCVAKVVSKDILHKTEAGGVLLNLTNEEQLADGVHAMDERIRRERPEAEIDGYLIQSMQKGLSEVLIGYRLDSLVGPTVVLSAGGILSEVYGDASVRLAPATHETAREMIEEVKGLAPIRGYRGLPKGDLDAIADTLVALSQLAFVKRPLVLEAEINPFMVMAEGQGGLAADGLIVLE
jgi:acyl-CoA synthetase (NDP forming)